jgi:hypothetical protein
LIPGPKDTIRIPLDALHCSIAAGRNGSSTDHKGQIMPRFLCYTFAGIILGVLVGVPLTYTLWSRQQYRNFHVVREGVLYRSGQLPEGGLKRVIYDHHIKTVVTLRYPSASDKPAPDAAEERMCLEQGLHYFRLPYQSWSGREDDGAVPAEANVQQFLEIMKDPRNHPVLVHCFAGIHRTGAMCAVYRMEFEHWSPQQAMQEMKDMGYAAHHQDVFGYLERYQSRGYGLARTDESSGPLIDVDAMIPASTRPEMGNPGATSPGGDSPTRLRGAMNLLFPKAFPRRFVHQAQPGDVVQIDLGPGVPAVGGRLTVQPDGTLNLGDHGSIHVTGLSHEQLPRVIKQQLPDLVGPVSLDLFPSDRYRSTCRVIVKGDMAGDQVFTLSWKPDHRLRDVIDHLPGELADVSNCRAWIMRRQASGKGPSRILAVDWDAMRQGEANAGNWRIEAGDEICIDTTLSVKQAGHVRNASFQLVKSSASGHTENGPDEAAILRAIKPAQSIPYLHQESRSNFEFVVEKTQTHLEKPATFFLIGQAQLEQTLWKCTVSYTENVRSLFPVPMQTQNRRVQVVYIDWDVLRPLSHE